MATVWPLVHADKIYDNYGFRKHFPIIFARIHTYPFNPDNMGERCMDGNEY